MPRICKSKQIGFFSWLWKSVIVCCDQTGYVSLFHLVVEVIATPHLPMAFLVQTKEIADFHE